MTYTRGTATAAHAAKTAIERERAEIERLYAEGRALAQTAKQLRQRNANIEAKIAEERERLEDKRARLTEAFADLDRAQSEADAAIRHAEEQAPLIRELAYDQARALAERAHRTGFEKGEDYARAQHAILSRPALAAAEESKRHDKRKKGVTNAGARREGPALMGEARR